MYKLRLVNLCKNYIKGQMDGVRNLNLNIEDGEFVSLLGPSGCGKSSTLRMIAGLEDVTSGEIWLSDRVINDVVPQKRNIAMVFENYALYTHKTVFDNIAFPLLVRKMSEAEIKSKVLEAADILKIRDILNEKAINLSGGQKQRVSIGRALVRDPEMLLMDEPISHLEAKLKTHMRAELKRLQKQFRRTTIYVTHDQYEAMTMADRIAVMNLAELQQFDVPERLFQKPFNEFVAGFIGEPPMNMFDCELIEENQNYFLASGNFKFQIPETIKNDIKKEQITTREMRLGLRPQFMTVRSQRSDEREIQGEVFHWEIHGDEGVLMAKVGQLTVMIKTSDTFKAQRGDNIYMDFDPEKINVFNKATSRNICIGQHEFDALQINGAN